MKKLQLFLVLVLLLSVIPIMNCNGQPKSDYQITSNAVSGATKYLFFLEKKPAVVPYRLQQGMDYLSPTVITLKIGESATPSFDVLSLDNDGSEYRVGVVAENAQGFYGGMGVNTGTVGIVPGTPANVIFRKKP